MIKSGFIAVVSLIFFYPSLYEKEKEGIKNGQLVQYNSKGYKFILNYRNDTLHGPYRVFYRKSKNTLQVGQFKMGYRDSIITNYYESGQIVNEVMYERGKKLWINYYKGSDRIVLKEIFIDSLSKTSIAFRENGSIDTGIVRRGKYDIYEGYIDNIENIK